MSAPDADRIAIPNTFLDVYEPVESEGTTRTYTVYSMRFSTSHPADFLDLGYWASDTFDQNNDLERSVGIFATGRFPFAYTNQNLNGSGRGDTVGGAKYVGPATGLYVADDGRSGQFAASAELTAHFWDENLDPKDWHSIQGTLVDFTDADGAAIDPTWSVNLERIQKVDKLGQFTFSNGAPNDRNGHLVFRGGTTSTGGSSATGEWRGGFYGSMDRLPNAAIGTFNANFDNGQAVGAFGALQDEMIDDTE